MSPNRSILGIVAVILVATPGFVRAVPVESGGSSTIGDRKNFIPNRKHVALPGKAVGVLAFDAQPVLTLEGRSGPANQFCFSYNGGSYRWVYVPVEKDAMIPWLNLPVGPTGAERKRFDKLSLASPNILKPFGIAGKYALVEVEVNGGLGSPPDDSFVATKMKVLDGSKEFSLKVEDAIADAQKRYQEYLKERSRDIDVGIEKAAAAAIKNKKATGPRERQDVMYVTWMADTERLRVHFRSTISDGAYQYEGGINIEMGPVARTAVVARVGANPIGRAPAQNLRYGTQFGIELGMAYEISKSGKLERSLVLPIETFQRDIKQPGLLGSGARSSTIRTMIKR